MNMNNQTSTRQAEHVPGNDWACGSNLLLILTMKGLTCHKEGSGLTFRTCSCVLVTIFVFWCQKEILKQSNRKVRILTIRNRFELVNSKHVPQRRWMT